MTDRTSQLRAQIMDLVGQFHAAQFAAKPFAPGESAIPVSGKVFDAIRDFGQQTRIIGAIFHTHSGIADNNQRRRPVAIVCESRAGTTSAT